MLTLAFEPVNEFRHGQDLHIFQVKIIPISHGNQLGKTRSTEI